MDSNSRNLSSAKSDDRVLRMLQAINRKLAIGKLLKVPNFVDEPKFYYYIAENSFYGFQGSGSAVALNDYSGIVRALGELIERHSLWVPKKTSLVATFLGVPRKYCPVNPLDYQAFSEEQLGQKALLKNVVRDDSRFRWIMAYDIQNGEKMLVPQQLGELQHPADEPLLRSLTSNGTAGWSSLNGAILRAILEVIERDAVMIHHLTKRPLATIELESCPESVIDLFNALSEYRIATRLLCTTTDLPTQAVVAMLFDRAPHPSCILAVGAKAHLNPETSIIGAILEALLERFSVKIPMLEGEKTKNIRTFRDHTLYWAKCPNPESKLAHLLDGKVIRFSNLLDMSRASDEVRLAWLRRMLKNHRLTGIYIPLMSSQIGKMGYSVVRAVIPAMQDIYSDQRFPTLGSERLSKFHQGGLCLKDYYELLPHPLG